MFQIRTLKHSILIGAFNAPQGVVARLWEIEVNEPDSLGEYVVWCQDGRQVDGYDFIEQFAKSEGF